uniref:Transposase n=1 Tax=Caenorhabditis tropicalis TaxID=1561998 RepID=A0A1I7T9A6_9PELO
MAELCAFKTLPPVKPIESSSKRRSKSYNQLKSKKNWNRLEDLKRQIIQLKRESEALRINRTRILEEVLL